MMEKKVRELRVTVFEKAAKMIRDCKAHYCCFALNKAGGCDSPEEAFFKSKYDNGQAFWFSHVAYGTKRQKARERALLRCANLIRKARSKGARNVKACR